MSIGTLPSHTEYSMDKISAAIAALLVAAGIAGMGCSQSGLGLLDGKADAGRGGAGGAIQTGGAVGAAGITGGSTGGIGGAGTCATAGTGGTACATGSTTVLQGVFLPASNMTSARGSHTATLLPSGKVLIAGGYYTISIGDIGKAGTHASAELYDAVTGTFTATGGMATARFWHTATLLGSGKVLIAGGTTDGSTSLGSCEMYDPVASTFAATSSMTAAREAHTATLLPNGKVLVAGGVGDNGYLASAELYDPASGAFMATGSMTTARNDHTATLLPSGKVLVAGGGNGPNGLASAELYDPARGTFTATGSMAAARYGHTATLLPSGKVLIAGEGDASGIANAELYDPASGTFIATGSMAAAKYGHTATLLPSGKVLIAGGYHLTNIGGFSETETRASAELFDPAAGTFAGIGSMTAPRYDHTATLLSNEKVLIAGGDNDDAEGLTSAELYDPCGCPVGASIPDAGVAKDAGRADTLPICQPIVCPAIACLGGTHPNPDPCGCSLCAPTPDAAAGKDVGLVDGPPTACPMLASLNPTDAAQVGYSARRKLLQCSYAGGTTEDCISSDATGCPGPFLVQGDLIGCSNLCTVSEYGLSYGGVGPSAAAPSVDLPVGCRLGLQTPAGVAFYCCPCGT